MIFTKLKKMSFEDSLADPSAKEGKRAMIKPENLNCFLQGKNFKYLIEHLA